MPTRSRVVVMFADIRGSSRWMRRMAEDEASRHTFMMAYDREVLHYKARTGSTFYKRIGDGRMIVHELDKNAKETAFNVLLEGLGLVKRVERMIASQPSPRPNGFRVRLMSGMVINEVYPDGETDWVGYVPNTTFKLLSVQPDVPILVQETFKDLIPARALRKRGLSFTHVKARRCPDGVDQEDADALYTISKIHKEK